MGTYMQKAFLFGTGAFFVFGLIVGVVEAFKSASTGGIIIAICLPLSVLSFWRATQAPPNDSVGRAIAGGIVGFVVMTVASTQLAKLASLIWPTVN